MIIESARLAVRDLFTKKSRSVLFKSLGLTILLLFGLWFVLEMALDTLLLPMLGPWPWFSTILLWLTGAGLFVGAFFLIAPVAAIFAGLFLDDVAKFIEERYYSDRPAGKPMPIGQSIWLSAKFFCVVLLANFFALMLVLLPGVNFAVFFFVNGYLLGREYFQFAAMRFRPEAETQEIYRQEKLTIFLGGLIVAGFMMVPILNLATPMFAAAMMAHLHKAMSGERPVLRAVTA